jgi:hypothetical protein
VIDAPGLNPAKGLQPSNSALLILQLDVELLGEHTKVIIVYFDKMSEWLRLNVDTELTYKFHGRISIHFLRPRLPVVHNDRRAARHRVFK